MDLDPRRLVVLAVVARAGGVLAAAESLRVTPSAVSQQLARLEREAGVALVVRGGRRTALTASGRLLAERGARIEAELALARADVAAVSDRVGGTVTLVAFPTAIAALVAPAARLLREAHPAVELRVVEAAEEPGLARLRAGAVDVVVVERDATGRAPSPRGLRDVELLEDAYVLAVPVDAVAPVSVGGLAGVDWVAGPVGSAARAALDGVAGRGRWQPRVTHEALEFPAVLALVAAGLGCALVPRLALATAPAAVRVVELHGLGARRLLARHRSSRSEPAPAVRAVVDALVVAAAGPV